MLLAVALLTTACDGAGQDGVGEGAVDVVEDVAEDVDAGDDPADDAGSTPEPGDDQAADEGEPVQGGTVTMAVNTEGNSLDPVQCTTNYPRCQPIYGTLMEYDAGTNSVVPSMAESMETDDGLTWTLTLRPDVTFTDGTPLDAEAVVFNWDRLIDPELLSPARSTASLLEWDAIDDLTVEITLQEPNFELPFEMIEVMGFIGSPTAIEEAGEDVSDNPVGAGPFTLVEWVRNSQIVLERNPDYWDAPRPYLDRYIVQVIGADDQRFNALRTGEINMMWTLLTEFHAQAADEGFDVTTLPLVGGTGVGFNMTDEHIGNDNLRLALMHAMDPQQTNDSLYPGDPGPDSFVLPEFPYRNDETLYPEHDMEAAQSFLDAYLEETGEDSVTVDFLTYAGIPILTQASEIFQAQMQQLDGLELRLEPVDGAQLVSDMAAGNYQSVLTGTIVTHPASLFAYFHSDGALNRANYSNPVVDEAFETARSTDDESVKEDAYTTIVREVSADGPIRVWRWQYTGFAHPTEVNGVRIYNIHPIPEYLWIGE